MNTTSKKIYMQNNQIEIIADDVFKLQFEVEILDLSNNPIKEINSNHFKYFLKLKELILFTNFIKIIDENSFSLLSSTLVKLDICYNMIESIENSGMNSLYKLETLEMNFKKIAAYFTCSKLN